MIEWDIKGGGSSLYTQGKPKNYTEGAEPNKGSYQEYNSNNYL